MICATGSRMAAATRERSTGCKTGWLDSHRPRAPWRCWWSAAIAAMAAAACSAPQEGESSRFNRHFQGQVWGSAVQAQFENPQQFVPEIGLLVAAPLVSLADDQIRDWLADHDITGSANAPGNLAEFLLLGATLGWGVYDWIDGDEGRWFELTGETLAVTGITVESLKAIFPRDRPDGHSGSFPSGHSALSFAAATLIARRIEDADHTGLGYLLYVPATYVALNRVESDKHWASDVVAGACIGLTLANLFYDAHCGEHGIFGGKSWDVLPLVDAETSSVGIQVCHRF